MLQNRFPVRQGKTYVTSAAVHHFMSVAAILAYAQ